MKKFLSIIAAAALLAPGLSQAKEPIQSGAMVLKALEKFAAGMSDKSKRALDTDVAMTMGYVVGVIDSDGGVCFDTKVSMAQVLLSVRDYVKAHPELLDRSGIAAVSGALREAYPCTAGTGQGKSR